MIRKGQIQKTIVWINRAYGRSRTQMEALYLSKLAILEVCGWTEESMDDIVRYLANRHLSESANLTFVETKVIERTYSFDYQRFRSMLLQVMGIINVERLERNLGGPGLDEMKAALTMLKTNRDEHAHKHVDGTMRIDAPSVTQRRFQAVYYGLKGIESYIRRMTL